LVQLLVLTIFSIALILFDRFSHLLDRIRYALSVPLYSVQYFAGLPDQLVHDFAQVITKHDVLLRENELLQKEQLLLRGQLQRLQAIQSENQQLRILLHAASTLQGRVLVARLLSVQSDPFGYRPLLDHGSHDGVYLGQPVLDAWGVMGQIIRVNPGTSQMLLINDPHSGVPVEIVRNGMHAIAAGDAFTGKLHLANVPQTADVKPGDLLVTSGMGRNYPEGYPVGRVEFVTKDPGQQFAIIEVTPLAHPERSREVLLVWPDIVQKATGGPGHA
jgi:rod shape-determining protein MreC